MVLAALAFFTARAAMQNEIEHGLVTQADAVASDITKIMFERLQNAAIWSTLEAMQDLQIQDVDKRLSIFLSKLKTGYGGVYHQLYALNRDGRVISSSNPAEIGTSIASPGILWQTIHLAGVTLTLELPQHKQGHRIVTIRTPILSQFTNDSIGELVLEMDWEQIISLLDSAASAHRSVILTDAKGAIFGVSHTRLQPTSSESSAILAADSSNDTFSNSAFPLAQWPLHQKQSQAFERRGATAVGWDSSVQVMVGTGHASEFAGFSGIGLIALVIQPERDTLAPIHRMAAISLALLVGLVLLILGIASKISGAIAHPIVALTDWTRRHTLQSNTLSPDNAAINPPAIPHQEHNEVGELASAFTQLMHDIEQAQQHLVRASKLAVVGEMASVIIHEVRTPLGIIRSSAQMLKREPTLSDEGRELTGFIESETERLNRLVSSMLDSARPRPINKVPTNLHMLIHHSSELLSAQLEQRHITVTEDLCANNPWVACDAEQLTQVLLNLIMNALQVLAPGGQIQLSTHERINQHINEFIIEIADNGPGIPADQRARLFDAFFCLREGGVGLGLAIVQQIIQAHGGDINASASASGGALFTVRLPRTASISAAHSFTTILNEISST